MRLMCPTCGEVSEQAISTTGKHHLEYKCAYAGCTAHLQADFKMRVEDVTTGSVSFGAPQPCTCERRDALSLTPQLAPETAVAQIQARLRDALKPSVRD